MRAKITTRFMKSLTPREKPYEIYDVDLTGFLVRVQPSGHMGYYLFYRASDGRKRQYRIGAADRLTVAQARDLAQQYAARAVTGEDIQTTKQRTREEAKLAKIRTLGGFLEEKYAPWVLEARKSGAATLARLRHNFADLLATPLQEISPWRLEKFRAAALKQGKARSTLNRDITALKAVMAKAVEWGILDKHPLATLKPFKLDTKGIIRYLTEDEERRLRHALAQRDAQRKAMRIRGSTWRRACGYSASPSLETHTYGDYLTPMVLLSLNTGLRRGELFSLRWGDVHLQTNTLAVHGDTTKTGQTRHIPLNREALAVLSAWRQHSQDEGLIFPGKNGEKFDNTRKSWGGVLKAAGIIGFRWHDMRHTFASKLVMAGVPLNTVRELLGHTTPTMTLRYAHLAPDHKAAAVELLSRAPGIDAVETALGDV